VAEETVWDSLYPDKGYGLGDPVIFIPASASIMYTAECYNRISMNTLFRYIFMKEV
jgi:hypothetical protein